MTIDTFDHATGWGTSGDIISDDFTDLDRLLEAIGFDAFDAIGETPSIKIYTREDSFLVSMDSPLSWRLIYCTDLPSCLDLLAKLEPWLRMGTNAVLMEWVTELQELLVTYGKDGPLEECLRRRETVFAARRRKA